MAIREEVWRRGILGKEDMPNLQRGLILADRSKESITTLSSPEVAFVSLVDSGSIATAKGYPRTL